jgi:hypothetical protein|tara:strand:- start:2129 stop:2233 length:105 start_codon:yes stop_codon:yes gene_type:complete
MVNLNKGPVEGKRLETDELKTFVNNKKRGISPIY